VKRQAKTTTKKTAPPAPIGETLRKAIVDSGLTSYALGKAAGVSSGMIDRFKRGERDLRLSTAEKLCETLGLTLAPRG
jgi:plasmid maintenance system antidote protein VapI